MIRASLVSLVLLVTAVPAQQSVTLDHLILGINDLERGIAEFEARTGVRPVFGGAHPGRGTHNALASLGNGVYVEILAPNPADAKPGNPTEGLDFLGKMTTLTPIGWALSASDLADAKARAEAAGMTVSQVRPGARTLPDGSTLEWVTVGVTQPAHNWAPFFIQWSNADLQPARTAPGGCTLTSVRLADPNPGPLRSLFDAVGFEMTLSQTGADQEGKMTVTLQCPNGTVTF
ncbi:MAG: VOC family protein [Acidobacteria bacterium]|nr:VOC family protein [Acidobacteriota bacterium]